MTDTFVIYIIDYKDVKNRNKQNTIKKYFLKMLISCIVLKLIYLWMHIEFENNFTPFNCCEKIATDCNN